jgi:hypothetical protein
MSLTQRLGKLGRFEIGSEYRNIDIGSFDPFFRYSIIP